MPSSAAEAHENQLATLQHLIHQKGFSPEIGRENNISGHLWEKITQEVPDIEDQFCSGEFCQLLAWLLDIIHKHGGKYEPQELVVRITGSMIDPVPYKWYLKKKYTGIYDL